MVRTLGVDGEDFDGHVEDGIIEEVQVVEFPDAGPRDVEGSVSSGETLLNARSEDAVMYRKS